MLEFFPFLPQTRVRTQSGPVDCSDGLFILGNLSAGRAPLRKRRAGKGSMNELAEVQRQFQAFVLDGPAGIERHVLGSEGVPVATRLAIYANAYRARLAEALASNYPVLAELLGARQFDEIARRYIERHSSKHFSIRWYGESLSLWLARQEPYSQRPLLAELADWEWKMTLAFDAADAPVCQRAAFSELAPEQWAPLRLKAHPSLQLLCLHTQAPAVWRALNHGQAPPAAALDSDVGVGEAQDWVIWRCGTDTCFRSLGQVEAAALRAAVCGASFGAVCEIIAEGSGEQAAPGVAATLLAAWVEDEMLAELGTNYSST